MPLNRYLFKFLVKNPRNVNKTMQTSRIVYAATVQGAIELFRAIPGFETVNVTSVWLDVTPPNVNPER